MGRAVVSTMELRDSRSTFHHALGAPSLLEQSECALGLVEGKGSWSYEVVWRIRIE